MLYGPQVAFVFSIGAGVHIAILDPDANAFRMTRIDVRIPAGSNEFAINASNSRYWPAPVRAYFEDCLEGDEGPRERNFNMRWVGSVAADVYRILVRGGVYLYPEDSREGYGQGRLRLLYEANPIALLIEQAGGAAIDGFRRILDVTPTSLHMRTPLIFGSKDKVERVARYYAEGSVSRRAPAVRQARSPPAVMLEPEMGAKMSIKHPIIAITGSSGAGTTSVKMTFEQIFRREKINPVYIEGDAFHRWNRLEMREQMKEAGRRGDNHYSHFGPDGQSVRGAREDIRRLLRNRRRAHPHLHPRRARGRAAQLPAREPSRLGANSSRAQTCSSTRACTAPSSPTRSMSPNMSI